LRDLFIYYYDLFIYYWEDSTADTPGKKEIITIYAITIELNVMLKCSYRV